ncbi:MAG: HEAT repeat domain-containing protein [Terriglobales bacterium]
MVSQGAKTEPTLLSEIASNESYKKWARIGAIYALGFLNHKASAKVLISILRKRSESLQVRSHAAEALGNMREDRASSTLGGILMSREPASLKKWCVYALSEIGTVRARAILKKFAATNPRGVLARELKSVAHRWVRGVMRG